MKARFTTGRGEVVLSEPELQEKIEGTKAELDTGLLGVEDRAAFAGRLACLEDALERKGELAQKSGRWWGK